MPPNQQIPQPHTSDGQSPYDFIFDGKKQKKSLIPQGNSPKQRKLIVIALIGAVLAFFLVVFMLLFSGGNSNITALTKIAQQQNEVIRIAGMADNKSRSNTTLIFAQNTKQSTTTSQQQVIAYLKKQRKIVSPKQLSLSQNLKTDALLKGAEQTGTYDEVLLKQLRIELATYQKLVLDEYKATSSSKEKAVLKPIYDQVVILLKSSAPASETPATSP